MVINKVKSSHLKTVFYKLYFEIVKGSGNFLNVFSCLVLEGFLEVFHDSAFLHLSTLE